MERRLPVSVINEPYIGTTGDVLDQAENLIGRIGFNNREQALELLSGLDEAWRRIEEMEDGDSRQRLQVRLEGLVNKLRAEARVFLRDLGGTGVLRAKRESASPPADNDWWYLDRYLVDQRKAAIRRSLVSLVVIAAVLGLVTILYNTLLAPDPNVVGRYSGEQDARDSLYNGLYQQSLDQVNLAMTFQADNSDLLPLRGVILEMLGRPEEAARDFDAAQKALSAEQFYLARAEAYGIAGQAEQALADTDEVLRINPDNPTAYLLRGQVYEILGRYQLADQAYDLAFEAANKTDQVELAAIARTRKGMLAQMLGAMPLTTPTFTPPAP